MVSATSVDWSSAGTRDLFAKIAEEDVMTFEEACSRLPVLTEVGVEALKKGMLCYTEAVPLLGLRAYVGEKIHGDLAAWRLLHLECQRLQKEGSVLPGSKRKIKACQLHSLIHPVTKEIAKEPAEKLWHYLHSVNGIFTRTVRQKGEGAQTTLWKSVKETLSEQEAEILEVQLYPSETSKSESSLQEKQPLLPSLSLENNETSIYLVAPRLWELFLKQLYGNHASHGKYVLGLRDVSYYQNHKQERESLIPVIVECGWFPSAFLQQTKHLEGVQMLIATAPEVYQHAQHLQLLRSNNPFCFLWEKLAKELERRSDPECDVSVCEELGFKMRQEKFLGKPYLFESPEWYYWTNLASVLLEVEETGLQNQLIVGRGAFSESGVISNAFLRACTHSIYNSQEHKKAGIDLRSLEEALSHLETKVPEEKCQKNLEEYRALRAPLPEASYQEKEHFAKKRAVYQTEIKLWQLKRILQGCRECYGQFLQDLQSPVQEQGASLEPTDQEEGWVVVPQEDPLSGQLGDMPRSNRRQQNY